MTFRKLVLCITAASCIGWSTTADAATGWARGYLQNYNRMHHYCPDGETCSGARYLESSYETYVGIPHAKVNVYGSGHTLIGSGVTSSSGYFNIFWNSGATGAPANAHLHVYPIHKDNRFRFRQASTSSYHGNSSTFALVNGGSKDIGTRRWDSDYFGNYWAAWKLWTRLDDSGGMNARFNDVWIYGFDDTIMGTTCTTSCARGYWDLGGGPAAANDHATILLDEDAERNTISRIMHEMGHVVQYYAGNRYRFGGSYNYQSNGGWSMTERERRPAALSEGFATFVSMAGLYNDYAPEPMSCFSQEQCYTAGTIHDVEDSMFNVGGCRSASEVGRWPLNSTRYFWDIYDELNDGLDTIDKNFYHLIDTFLAYSCPNKPDCFGYQQKHSQFDFVSDDLSSTSYEGNLDAGHMWEFRSEMLQEKAIETDDEYFNNCLGYF